MPTNKLDLSALKLALLNKIPLIDVRAPVEFHQGHLPNAVNFPILNDQERADVGLLYKQKGQEAAVNLGHQLVSGAIKEERVQAWVAFIRNNPNAVLYCFRGGQRSQISQRWLKEVGLDVPLIEGGYKKGRNLLLSMISHFAENQPLLTLCGPTGSGKTHLLAKVQRFYPVVDLEEIALHRGSAFGSRTESQPSQADFENGLASELLQLETWLENSKLRPLFEDESRLIGRCALPGPFYQALQKAPVVWINEPLENRIEIIFQDYILRSAIGFGQPAEARGLFAHYRKALAAISRRLGGLRTKEIDLLLQEAQVDYEKFGGLDKNRNWIERLLVYYYDPLYARSMANRNPRVLFKGTSVECQEFLRQRGSQTSGL